MRGQSGRLALIPAAPPHLSEQGVTHLIPLLNGEFEEGAEVALVPSFESKTDVNPQTEHAPDHPGNVDEAAVAAQTPSVAGQDTRAGAGLGSGLAAGTDAGQSGAQSSNATTPSVHGEGHAEDLTHGEGLMEDAPMPTQFPYLLLDPVPGTCIVFPSFVPHFVIPLAGHVDSRRDARCNVKSTADVGEGTTCAGGGEDDDVVNKDTGGNLRCSGTCDGEALPLPEPRVSLAFNFVSA